MMIFGCKYIAAIVFLAGMAAASPACAAVFPGPPTSKNLGGHEGIYMAIRGLDATPLSQTRIDQIRASELETRQFFAANSGGAYNVQYRHILDVPLMLDGDGTRKSTWRSDAESYVRSQYGIEPQDFHLNVFDVSATTPDPDQGWSGLAWIPGNDIAIQANINTNWGQLVADHEIGHRVGSPHSGAWRTLNNNDYSSYVWDRVGRQYVPYNAVEHGHQATAYGMRLDEYGNPFDVMGNISRGHFSVHEKLTDFHWLTSTQVPDLATLGAGNYRIYAHDELVPVESRQGEWGVEETYDPNVLYGLTYTRQAERFNPGSDAFNSYNQTITLEYRAGRDGVQFVLNDAILDLDPEGGLSRDNRERELEVGQRIEDIDFGMSVYWATEEGDNFLSYTPPAPSNPWEILPQWYEFTVLGTASDLIGNYIDISVAIIDGFKTGDLNDDGFLNVGDIQTFISHWLDDTSGLNSFGKHSWGDIDFSGFVDQNDWYLLRQAFLDDGARFSAPFTIPEPASAVLVLLSLVLLGCRRSRNDRR